MKRVIWLAIIGTGGGAQAFASERYCTRLTDTPANLLARGILQTPRVLREYGNALIGGDTVCRESLSELELITEDGLDIAFTRGDSVSLRFCLTDSSAANSWVGAPLASFTVAGTYQIAGVETRGNRTAIKLESELIKLQERFCPIFDVLGGYTALRGKARPVTLGEVVYVPPLFAQSVNTLDPQGWHVALNYEQIVSIYMDGLLLTAGTDYTLTATGFELTIPANNTLQVHIKGEKLGGVWVENLTQCVEYVFWRLSISATLVGATNTNRMGLFISNENDARSVLTELLDGANAGLYRRVNGDYSIGSLTVPGGTDYTLHADDTLGEASFNIDEGRGITGTYHCAINPGVISQTEDTSGSLFSERTRGFVPIVGNFTGHYALANQKPARDIAVYNGADAQAIMDESVDLYAGIRYFGSVQVLAKDWLGVELLSTLAYTDRAQFASAQIFYIVGVNVVDDLRVELKLWGGF